MIKKLSAMLLVIVMCGSFSACSESGGGSDDGLTATHTLSRGDKDSGGTEAGTAAAEEKKEKEYIWVLAKTSTNALDDYTEPNGNETRVEVCDAGELVHTFTETRTYADGSEPDAKIVFTTECSAPPATIKEGENVTFELKLNTAVEGSGTGMEFESYLTYYCIKDADSNPRDWEYFETSDGNSGFSVSGAELPGDSMTATVSAEMPKTGFYGESTLLIIEYSSKGCQTYWTYEMQEIN